MKRGRASLIASIVVVLSILSAAAQDTDAIRPTGVPEPLSTPRAKKHVRHVRVKKDDDDEAPAPVPQKLTGGIPATRAQSVIVVDAHSGQVLYEKNADQQRAVGSTQKLLTALIVSERGLLDRQVRVEQVDTLAEPVKLNIKQGEVYQRIDLLRALLVKKSE